MPQGQDLHLAEFAKSFCFSRQIAPPEILGEFRYQEGVNLKSVSVAERFLWGNHAFDSFILCGYT